MSLWNQGSPSFTVFAADLFSETLSSEKFCDFLRMRSLHRSSHSVAFLCTDSRRAVHRMPHAFFASHPSVSFTSFAAHVKHHVLSESIPFPFGLYVCLPLSCLDVKCTLDMNPPLFSRPPLPLPTQVPHRPIINAEPSLFCQSVGQFVVKLTLLR